MVRSIYIIVLTLLVANPVSAASVGEAKASGHACEQTNGYLQATGSAPPDVQSLVRGVNVKRKAQYSQIAEKNGVPVDQVAKLTAEKLINSAPQYRCK